MEGVALMAPVALSCGVSGTTGLLERKAQNSCLALESGYYNTMMQLQGRSITDRSAVGPQQGCKVFSLQTLRRYLTVRQGSTPLSVR